VKAEGLTIDSVEEAWELAKIRLRRRRGIPLQNINNATEIPGLSPQHIEELNKGGVVTRWTMKVARDGIITVQKERVAREVGQYSGLA